MKADLTLGGVTLRPEERALYTLRSLYSAYGYSSFKMTKFEEYDLYVRNKNFLISDHIITFTDTGGKLMALKPDVTLSIVKNTKDEPEGLKKVYYNENVYRVTGKTGSYREILQTGLECIGKVDRYCLFEVLTLAVKSLAALSEAFVLAVSDLDLVSGAIDLTGISPAGRKKLLRSVGAKNLHGIDETLAAEGIEPEKADLLKTLVTSYGKPADVKKTLAEAVMPDNLRQKADELIAMLEKLPADAISVDFSTVSDLRYYNGIVFQGFLRGIPTAILSGGQYDRLMERMGRTSRAVGFAVYLDLLEDLVYTRAEYDYGNVILYDSEEDYLLVASLVEEAAEKGESAVAMKKLPENIRYKRLISVKNGEVKYE